VDVHVAVSTHKLVRWEAFLFRLTPQQPLLVHPAKICFIQKNFLYIFKCMYELKVLVERKILNEC